jgi:hypothetical protein
MPSIGLSGAVLARAAHVELPTQVAASSRYLEEQLDITSIIRSFLLNVIR